MGYLVSNTIGSGLCGLVFCRRTLYIRHVHLLASNVDLRYRRLQQLANLGERLASREEVAMRHLEAAVKLLAPLEANPFLVLVRPYVLSLLHPQPACHHSVYQ